MKPTQSQRPKYLYTHELIKVAGKYRWRVWRKENLETCFAAERIASEYAPTKKQAQEQLVAFLKLQKD